MLPVKTPRSSSCCAMAFVSTRCSALNSRAYCIKSVSAWSPFGKTNVFNSINSIADNSSALPMFAIRIPSPSLRENGVQQKLPYRQIIKITKKKNCRELKHVPPSPSPSIVSRCDDIKMKKKRQSAPYVRYQWAPHIISIFFFFKHLHFSNLFCLISCRGRQATWLHVLDWMVCVCVCDVRCQRNNISIT